jgi:hypothetical protein
MSTDAFGGLPNGHRLLLHPVWILKSDNNVLALDQMKGGFQRAALVSTLVAVRFGRRPEPLIAAGRVVSAWAYQLFRFDSDVSTRRFSKAQHPGRYQNITTTM